MVRLLDTTFVFAKVTRQLSHSSVSFRFYHLTSKLQCRVVEVTKVHSKLLFGIYLHCISKNTHGGSKEALLYLEFKMTLE